MLDIVYYIQFCTKCGKKFFSDLKKDLCKLCDHKDT